MKRIFASIVIPALLFYLTACLKPDPIDMDQAVDVNFVDVLETTGFARDVFVVEDKIFVAASQAGIQIWQDQNGQVSKEFEHHFSQNPVLRVTVEPETGLLFTFDRNQGFYKLLGSDLMSFDSVYLQQPTWLPLFESGLFGSGANEDFIVKGMNDSLVALYVIDRTSNDGLKQYYFNRRLNSSPNFHYWELNNVGASTGGINLGLDLRDTLLAISHDELGVGLYRLDGVNIDTLNIVDTPGETREVKFYKDYLLTANNMAGMGIFALGSGDSSLTHVVDIEVAGWVKQISIWQNIAILSCGENGIFLVDLSDPEQPKVDQAVDAGYTYRTFVAENMIYAATRSGVKRYRIENR